MRLLHRSGGAPLPHQSAIQHSSQLFVVAAAGCIESHHEPLANIQPPPNKHSSITAVAPLLRLPCCLLAAADIKAELLKLNRGLLFLFLELLTVLVQQPSGYSSALSPVMVTLHNMMHLINLARHHQVGPQPQPWLQTAARSTFGSGCTHLHLRLKDLLVTLLDAHAGHSSRGAPIFL